MKVKRGEEAAEEKSEAGGVWFMTFRERNHHLNIEVQVKQPVLM